MPSSEKLRRVVLVNIDVSKKRTPSIIKVTRIHELGRTLAVSSNRSTLRRNILSCHLMMDALRSSETSVLTRAILHSPTLIRCSTVVRHYSLLYLSDIALQDVSTPTVALVCFDCSLIREIHYISSRNVLDLTIS
jgi:hypothetical protein